MGRRDVQIGIIGFKRRNIRFSSLWDYDLSSGKWQQLYCRSVPPCNSVWVRLFVTVWTFKRKEFQDKLTTKKARHRGDWSWTVRVCQFRFSPRWQLVFERARVRYSFSFGCQCLFSVFFAVFFSLFCSLDRSLFCKLYWHFQCEGIHYHYSGGMVFLLDYNKWRLIWIRHSN